MDFPSPLVHGHFIKREKRFLAYVWLTTGEVVTAHCTNSGSMKSCLEEGAEVFLSPNDNPDRKTRYTWEMIKIGDGWVGVNTSNPNRVAFQWIKNGIIPGIEGYTNVTREVTFGNSRFDLMAENENEKCFIEVKNVTLKDGDFARFPDAITERGQKHLKTLMEVKQNGMRAIMLYIVQRTDVEIFAPAWDIDPKYGALLVDAFEAGVEIFPFQVKVSPTGIEPHRLLPMNLSTSR
jgi:sugar fermentation stimulation protein A